MKGGKKEEERGGAPERKRGEGMFITLENLESNEEGHISQASDIMKNVKCCRIQSGE